MVEIMEEKQRSISTVFLTEPVTRIEIIHLKIYVAYVGAESFVEIWSENCSGFRSKIVKTVFLRP